MPSSSAAILPVSQPTGPLMTRVRRQNETLLEEDDLHPQRGAMRRVPELLCCIVCLCRRHAASPLLVKKRHPLVAACFSGADWMRSAAHGDVLASRVSSLNLARDVRVDMPFCHGAASLQHYAMRGGEIPRLFRGSPAWLGRCCRRAERRALRRWHRKQSPCATLICHSSAAVSRPEWQGSLRGTSH